jgi:hypothetical protein
MARDRHPGVLVGFAVGLLLCSVGLLAWPGGAVGRLPVVGTTVEVGTLAGAVLGVPVPTAAGVAREPGESGAAVGTVVGEAGVTVCSVGLAAGRSAGPKVECPFPGFASGTGRSGVCMVGPPSTVLTKRTT